MTHGFTLVELLVVIAIIAVLLALLTPAMDRAMGAAQTARCGGNEHAIGLAMHLYLQEHKGRYPQLPTYYALMGNSGINYTADVRSRPLNAYLNYLSDGSKVAVGECPSDKGDSFEAPLGMSSYNKWGTSYLPAWYHDPICRTKAVFGNGTEPKVAGVSRSASDWYELPKTTSMSQRQMERTDNKLILADWPWYGNRHYNVEVNQWHTDNPLDRRFNTLFADAHVELFYFDRDLVEDGLSTDGYGDPNNMSVNPANPSNPWW